MNSLLRSVKPIVLLRWVADHVGEPFDPIMVVNAKHTSDWPWKAVLDQMEGLRRDGYIVKLREDASGSTYWAITTSGRNYLSAYGRFEPQVPTSEQGEPHETVEPQVAPKPFKSEAAVAVTPRPAAAPAPGPTPEALVTDAPVPTPKKRFSPFLERLSLRIRHLIKWEEMPTHLAAHLTYETIKYLIFGGLLAIIATLTWLAIHIFRWLAHWMHAINFKG
jgi:hypothetical protein